MQQKILIVDAYTPAHIGNGVLLNSSINVIQKAFPQAEIRILTLEMTTLSKITDFPFDEFLFRFPVRTNQLLKLIWLVKNSLFCLLHALNLLTVRISPRKLAFSKYRKLALQRIEEADFVISITGEAINDRTRSTLPFFLFTYWLASTLKKKMVIFPQSIGPLQRRWTRLISSYVLKRCSLVIGRDDLSMEELRGLGLTNNYVFSPDVGVIQPCITKTDAKKILAKQNVVKDGKKLVGFSLSTPKEDGVAKVDHIKILLESVQSSFTPDDVVFLILPANMPLKGIDDGDLADCELFARGLPGYDVTILEPRIYSPEEYKGILSVLDLFITSRMHVSILATMATTPTITLNTQRKLFGFMSNIDQEDLSVSLDGLTADKLNNVITGAMESLPAIKRSLETSALQMGHKMDGLAKVLVERLTLFEK